MFFRIGILSFLYCASTYAEYRVYQYVLKNENPNDNRSMPEIITSTFPPHSFQAYGGGRSIQAELLGTWTCLGNTAGKSFCLSPLAKKELQPEVEAAGKNQ